LNARRLIARTILVIALILLSLNIAAYDLMAETRNNTFGSISTGYSVCSSYFTGLEKNVTYIYRGKSISGQRVDIWYDLYGCGNKIVYVRVSKPLNESVDKAVILVHDYTSDYRALIGLSLELVSRGFMTVLIGLSREHPLPNLFTENIRNSWIYEASCDIIKVVTLVKKEYGVGDIGVIGFGFGGNAAILAAEYDDRIGYAASITGLGDYDYSLEKASLLNYYILDKDMLQCLDPSYALAEVRKPVLIIIGVFDEINPLDPILLNRVARNNNVLVSIVPNSGRYYIPQTWSNILFKFIDKASLNQEFVYNDISVEDDNFQVTISSKNYSDVIVLTRPLIPGWKWSINRMMSEKMRFSYFIIPGEYIVISRGMYRFYGYYYTSECYGVVVALILILVWILLERDIIVGAMKRLSILEYAYVFTLSSILFYTSYPSLLSPGRYHVSLNIVADIYAVILSIISVLIMLSLFLEPILLVYMFSRHSRKAYSLYLGIPLFIFILTYSSLLLLGVKFYNIPPLLPSTVLIPIALAIALDYILSRRMY
jgi:dienelactone hydrolase